MGAIRREWEKAGRLSSYENFIIFSEHLSVI